MSTHRSRRNTRPVARPAPSNGHAPGAQEAVAAVLEAPEPTTPPEEAAAADAEERTNEAGTGKMENPAVLVMRVPTGQPGEERIEFMEVNGIDPLAVPTLLRMAANLKEKQLGIKEGR